MNNVLRRGGQSQFEMKAGTCSFFPHFCLFVQKRVRETLKTVARPDRSQTLITFRGVTEQDLRH